MAGLLEIATSKTITWMSASSIPPTSDEMAIQPLLMKAGPGGFLKRNMRVLAPDRVGEIEKFISDNQLSIRPDQAFSFRNQCLQADQGRKGRQASEAVAPRGSATAQKWRAPCGDQPRYEYRAVNSCTAGHAHEPSRCLSRAL